MGYDEFIYVVDSANEQVLRYDLALIYGKHHYPWSTESSTKPLVPSARHRHHDTTIAGVNLASPLYDIDLVDDQAIGFNNVIAEPVLVHPFYFKIVSPPPMRK